MLEPDRIRDFSPFNALSAEGLRLAAEACRLRTFERGQELFRQGQSDPEAFFLLAGEVALAAAGFEAPPLVVIAGSETAQHPLARLKPRRYTGTARTLVTVAVIDEDRLDELLSQDQMTAYEVTVFEGDDPAWMFRLVHEPAFQRLPTSQLAALFARLQEVQVRAGETIVRQGDPGDFYYLIRSGRARVERGTAEGKTLVLATLGSGDGFGEEALLSGEPRNASVTMLEDGILMRLAQEDFEAILRPPLIHWVEAADALAMREAGAVLVDARLEGEHAEGSLAGSLNIPLYLLRIMARNLDRSRTYLCFCQGERRGAVAAFLLSERGFDARAVRGGLGALLGTAQFGF